MAVTWVRDQKSFYNEYLFHDMVQRLNNDLEREGYSVVKTSQARHLRRKMDAQLAQYNNIEAANQNMQQATAQQVMAAFSDLVRNDPNVQGGNQVISQLSDPNYRLRYAAETMSQFKGLTGIRTGKETYAIPSVDPKGGEWLPISPYMPELSNRDSVIRLGSNLGLLRRADVEGLVRENTPDKDALTRATLTKAFGAGEFEANLYQYDMNNGSFTARSVGPVFTQHDASGVAALRAFMSEQEFNDITADYGGMPWTSAAKDAEGNTLYMSDESITRVRDVVATLRSRGEYFEFRKDSRPGQVCVQFANKMQLRVIDPYDEQFAGARMYDEGYVIQMQTQDRGGMEQSWQSYVPQSADECMDLINVAMGREVARWDNPKLRVGSPSTVKVGTAYNRRDMNEAFHSSDGSFRATIGASDEGKPVSVYFKKHSRTGSKIFKTKEDAQSYLSNMVTSSRERFQTELDVDAIIELSRERAAQISALEAEDVPDDELAQADAKAAMQAAKGVMPMYSQDPVIKAVQEKYWRTLTDENAPILYNPRYVHLDEEDNEHVDEEYRAEAMYEGIPEEVVRQHAQDMAESAVGVYLGPGQGPQFDPVLVSRYATNGYSMFRNNDDLMSAMRRAGHEPEDLTGNAFYNDVVRSRLVSFNPATAQPIQDRIANSPFMKNVYQTVGKAVKDQGCEVLYHEEERPDGSKRRRYHIDIDDNGIIRYEARMKSRQRVQGRTGTADNTVVIGEIGQVFEPDENGVVATKTHMFVPGYEGVVVPNKVGENKPYEERIKLRGYEQVITESIRENVHQAFISSMREEDVAVPDYTSIATQFVDFTMAHGEYEYFEDPVQPEERDDVIRQMAAEFRNGDTEAVKDYLGEYLADEDKVVTLAVAKEATRLFGTFDEMEMAQRFAGEKVKYATSPTSMNRAVQHLYDVRLPLDFYESHLPGGSREGISEELQHAIIDTYKGRIKLSNDLMEESGRQNLYRNAYRPGAAYDKFNDNSLDGISLTDARNPAILEAPGDGFFDPYFTGNGPAQGNIRYLAEGATVGSDGFIVPSKDIGARCPLVRYMQEQGRQPDFDAVDRMCMSGNGLLQGLRETEPVGMAQVTFGFQTFEDGIVISKEFAEKYRVPDAHGEGMRALKSGDKIECHGNKGVVSLIVDRGMDMDDAKAQGIEEAVAWYKANPGLDVVMSPYSAVSRFNAGMAREAMASNPETLIAPDGTAYPGSLGHVRMTVLKQTVDTKSHSNTEDGQQRRSYGAQLSWALAANDCTDVLKDSYADNFKALADVREYLIACGMDMDETGRFRMGYQAHVGEERNIFKLPELDYYRSVTTKTQLPDGTEVPETTEVLSENYTVNMVRMRENFTKDIATKGGFVELPFALKYPTGAKFEAHPSVDDPSKTVYRMPIMSSFMRAGQEFQSGESVTHDYTNEYIRIFERAVEYRDAEARMERAISVEAALSAKKRGEMTPEDQQTLDTYGAWYEKAMEGYRKKPQSSQMSYRGWCQSEMEAAESAANSDYAKITRNITEKRFATKHNIWRTGIMANKQSNSATAVWHPDPTCPVDTVRMGSEMAETLGLARRDKTTDEVQMKPNAMALIHRDPVLRGSGIRYMRVELDADLVGISVHPAGIPGGMDGDFDGDSVGVHVLEDVDAKYEARQKLSVAANLLDTSSYDTKTGRYKLFIADGQDVAAGWAADADRRAAYLKATGTPMPGMSLKDRYEELEVRVNAFEAAHKAGEMDDKELAAKRAVAVHDVGSYLHDCAQFGFGRHVLSYASPEAHIQSIEKYVDDGAKGSLGKVQTYAKYAGIEYQTTADGHLKGKAVLHDTTQASRDDHIGILKAKNMQQQYTGTGGSFSIRAMRALTNVCPDEASRLNYLATQGVLQSKHDPHMSDRFEHILSGAARDLWRGYKLERAPGESLKNQSFDLSIDPATGERRMVVRQHDTDVVNWKVVRDSEGKPVAATKQEFVEQFMDVYGSKDGLGLKVNPKLVESIADACSYYDPRRQQDVMMSIEPDVGGKSQMVSACDRYAAPLQKLAYDGTFDTIRELAAAQQSDPSYPGLFDVPAHEQVRFNYNRAMADATVMRHNLDVRDAMREAEAAGVAYDGAAFKPIIRPDVDAHGRERNVRGVKLDTGLTEQQRMKQAVAQKNQRDKSAETDVDKLIGETVTLREVDTSPVDLQKQQGDGDFGEQ